MINSERLSLHKFTPTVFSDYRRIHENEKVMKYITGRALNEDEIKLRFEKALEVGNNSQHLGFFSVVNVKEHQFLGISKLVEFSEEEIEIGYSLLPEYWRKGFASEIVGCLTNYYCQLNLQKSLVAIVNPNNSASEKVLIKKGFTYYKTENFNGQISNFYKLLS